jgi:MYXO-CTERM domain-containing protein
MKLLGASAIAILALVAAVPTAQAQAPTGLTLTCAELAAPIPYSGSANLSCTATVGCLEAVTNQGTTVTFAVASPPAWLSSSGAEGDIDPVTCLGGAGTQAITVDVPLTVTKDAPGVEETTLTVTAAIGGTTADTPAIVTVAYNWNYTLTTDATFPLTVTQPTTTFNLTVTQSSNARSMVMMEQVKTTAGVISGLTSTVYESGGGKSETKVFKVTFKAPEGEWTEAKVDFMAFGHYLLLDSRSGDYDDGTAVSWTFANGGVEPVDEDTGGGKDASAPVGALLALGLVGLAAFVRRQK